MLHFRNLPIGTRVVADQDIGLSPTRFVSKGTEGRIIEAPYHRSIKETEYSIFWAGEGVQPFVNHDDPRVRISDDVDDPHR